MKTLRKPVRGSGRQSGSVLLEALFGILIFSMGILALVGLQATSIKQVASGKYRTDASQLANQLVGLMWISDRTSTTLITNFSSPSGTAYSSWLTDVQAALPGADTYPPTVSVIDVVGSSSLNTHRQATITMRWKAPSEAAAVPVHSYLLVAQIK
jgi:type IV pilus assembly protein PilV